MARVPVSPALGCAPAAPIDERRRSASSLHYRKASIDHHYFSSDEARLFRKQEHDTGGDLFCPRDPPERVPTGSFVQRRKTWGPTRIILQGCVDISRTTAFTLIPSEPIPPPTFASSTRSRVSPRRRRDAQAKQSARRPTRRSLSLPVARHAAIAVRPPDSKAERPRVKLRRA